MVLLRTDKFDAAFCNLLQTTIEEHLADCFSLTFDDSLIAKKNRNHRYNIGNYIIIRLLTITNLTKITLSSV